MKKTLLILSLLIITSSEILSTPGPQWVVYNTSNSNIPSNQLLSIEIDINNIKWIGTANGLVKFDGNSWLFYNTNNSPINNAVQRIKKDGYNNIWFCVYTQGLMNFKNNVFTVYNSSNSGLPFNNLWDIAIESDTIKWMSTFTKHKLVRFDGASWNVYDTSNSGFKNDDALTIEIIGHTKWFGTGFNGLGKFNDTTWTYFTPENSGMQDYTVFSICIDNPNLVWIGTRFKGVHKFNILKDEWTYYNTNNSPLPDNQISNIFKSSRDESIFFAPVVNGVAKLLNGMWTLYGSPLPKGTGVQEFKMDKYGNIWMATSDGLFVYNPDGVVEINDQTTVVNDFELFQNYPNPFNPTTKILYDLKKFALVELKVFDVNGKLIKILDNGFKNVGAHEIIFNSGGLASGIYFYTLTTEKFTETKRMVLIK